MKDLIEIRDLVDSRRKLFFVSMRLEDLTDPIPLLSPVEAAYYIMRIASFLDDGTEMELRKLIARQVLNQK